jgi:hypothetical protein
MRIVEAWTTYWECACGTKRLRLPFTRCGRCKMTCPDPNGGELVEIADETETLPTADEMVEWLRAWCAKHDGLTLELEGEVGFGRECVGILYDTGLTAEYVDYDVYDMESQSPTPYAALVSPGDEAPNAYHKHDCLAVLGRGDEPLAELYLWVRRLDAAGATIERDAPRDGHDVGSLLFGKTTRTRVVVETKP